MRFRTSRSRSAVGLLAALLLCASPAAAQVVTDIRTDGSTGPIVQIDGVNGIFEVPEELGDRPGGGKSLLQGLERADVGAPDTLLFTAALPTENVIAKISGGASSIYGKIASSIPGANLYLLNPAGIMFGPNATLDVQGSFISSTADSLVMADAQGNEFDAFSGDARVAFADPRAFGFFGDPAPITVDQSVLIVPNGETLGFVGGDIQVNGGPFGFLAAPGGQILIVSVASDGEVRVDPTDPTSPVDVSSFTDLGSIRLSDFALLETGLAFLDAGRIVMRGGELVLEGGSVLAADDGSRLSAPVGIESGGLVDIDVSGEVRLTGGAVIDASAAAPGVVVIRAAKATLELGSEILVEARGDSVGGGVDIDVTDALTVTSAAAITSALRGSGKGPTLVLEGATVSIEDGARVTNNVFGNGEAGDTTITGGSVVVSNALLETASFDPDFIGNPGALTIDANDLTVTEGALVSSANTGAFDALPIRLDVEELSVERGASVRSSASDPGLFAGAGFIGDGADIVVPDARIVNVRSGGRITSVSQPFAGQFTSFGNAGDVEIHARESISVMDEPGARESQIGSLSFGVVDPATGQILVLNAGDAGKVTLNVPQGAFEMTGGSLFSQSLTSFGNTAGIDVTAGAVALTDGADVSTESDVAGDSGEIHFRVAGDMRVVDGTIQTNSLGEGDVGNLTLEASLLELIRSLLTAQTNGTGASGDLSVVVDRLAVLDGSELSNSSAIAGILPDGTLVGSTGAGGKLEVVASESVTVDGRRDLNGVSVRSQISNTNFDGVDTPDRPRLIRIVTPHLEVSNGGSIQATTFGAGNGGDIDADVATLVLRDGGSISSDTSGEIDAGIFVLPASTGNGGLVDIDATESIRIEGIEAATGSESGITTITLGFGNAGGIEITTPLLTMDQGRISADTVSESPMPGTPGGSAGNIDLDVGKLVLTDGAQVSSNSTFLAGFGQDPAAVTGRAGVVTVSADEIEISGSREDPTSGEDLPSGIFSATFTSADSGNIVVDAGQLTIAGEGQIGTDSLGAGNGGNVTLTLDTLAMTGDAEIGSDAESTGNGGNVTVNARVITLEGDPEISADTEAEGDGGRVELSASESITISQGPLTFDDQGEIDGRAGIFTNAKEDSEGAAGDIEITTPTFTIEGGIVSATTDSPKPGGEITLNVETLVMDRGAAVTSAATGEGAAGSITISPRAASIQLTGSSIETRSEESDAGRIEVNTANLELVSSSITARAENGFGGSININGDAVVPGPNGGIRARVRPDQSPGQLIRLRDSSITTSVGTGAGDGGNVLLNARNIVVDETPITATAVGGNGGNILLAAGNLTLASGGNVGRFLDASSETGIDGIVENTSPTTNVTTGVTPLEVPFQDASRLMRPSCAARGAREAGGSFHVARRQGLPSSPEGLLLAFEDVEVGADVAAQPDGATPDVAAPRSLDVARGEVMRGAAAFRSGDFDDASRSFEEAARLAGEAGEPERQAQALSNAARAALDAGGVARAKTLLGNAEAATAALPPSRPKAYLEIHLAKSHERVAAADPASRETSLLAAHAALMRAVELSRSLGATRARSYALGNLGSLYHDEGRLEEALFATRRALGAAEEAGSQDALYRWLWQEGQVQWAQGRPADAIASYRRAVEVLEDTRQAALARYGTAEVHFRRLVAPVYLELVSALLLSSEKVQNDEQADALLVEARGTMELFKAAELRDYFRDDCAADTTPIESVAGAAVVYPIPLPDRLELLVNFPNGIERFNVPVGADQLDETVGRYRAALGDPITPNGYVKPSRQLYDWLVRPYAGELEARGIETLVFVPGGSLRTVPMAALHDGQSFLIERFALALTPGLSLVDPRPLDPEGAKLLLAGVSEGVQGFEPLPMVPAELAAVQELYGGDILLDAAFGIEQFEAQVERATPSVVHLASHAIFTGDPATSFLLTHDDKLTLDRMAQVVAPTQFRTQPLEMLVLSACETAAGDERAALGLAGVAIRAGARSALGSLWTISDDAAYELIVDFYTGLKDPSLSKAEALQQAQRQLIAGERFSHPFFWSPYLLISNWL